MDIVIGGGIGIGRGGRGGYPGKGGMPGRGGGGAWADGGGGKIPRRRQVANDASRSPLCRAA